MTSARPMGRTDLRPGSRLVRALLIPADEEQRCQVIEVEYSAAGFSDAIGGGRLADVYYGDLTQPTGDSGWRLPDGRYCFYADEDRVSRRLPVNPRADVLAARLGCIGELRSIPMAGDVLITGATPDGDDTDIPGLVLAAAWRAGLLHRPPTAAGSTWPAPPFDEGNQ